MFEILPKFDKARKGKKCVITSEMRPVFDELKKNRNGSEHVFTYNDRPVKSNKFSRAWNEAVLDAGFEPEIDEETGRKKSFYTFHDLRTTGITELSHNGDVGFKTIQDIAGQHDAKTTQGYMKRDWEKQKKAAQSLTLKKRGKNASRI